MYLADPKPYEPGRSQIEILLSVVDVVHHRAHFFPLLLGMYVVIVALGIRVSCRHVT